MAVYPGGRIRPETPQTFEIQLHMPIEHIVDRYHPPPADRRETQNGDGNPQEGRGLLHQPRTVPTAPSDTPLAKRLKAFI